MYSILLKEISNYKSRHSSNNKGSRGTSKSIDLGKINNNININVNDD